jgi:NAD(P)-dependent dehydrogenase (short-subunit alcohol dehydrogenase family)
MFQSDLLEGKRILVTGGGTGLGKTISRRLLELGAEVAIVGRRKSILEDAAQELSKVTGGKVTSHELDISVGSSVDGVVGDIWAGGPLDGLVNSADDNFVSRTEDLSPYEFDTIANTVMHGTFYVTNAVGRRWIASGHKGSVVSIVATYVWTGSAFVTPSSMSKAGVAAMTQGLAVEWGPKGIRINAMALGTGGGSMETDAIPMRRNSEPSELANMAVFLLSDQCAYLTGEVIAIDGGQWLNGAGTFTRHASMPDEDWKALRKQPTKGSGEKTPERDA